MRSAFSSQVLCLCKPLPYPKSPGAFELSKTRHRFASTYIDLYSCPRVPAALQLLKVRPTLQRSPWPASYPVHIWDAQTGLPFFGTFDCMLWPSRSWAVSTDLQSVIRCAAPVSVQPLLL